MTAFLHNKYPWEFIVLICILHMTERPYKCFDGVQLLSQLIHDRDGFL